MSSEQIISKLKALELLFETGRKEAYSLRINLERFHAPAPSGDYMTEDEASRMAKILNRRKSQFYKKPKK